LKTPLAGLFLFIALAGCGSEEAEIYKGSMDEVLTHGGMCDPSASISVGNDLFLAASDEDNVLRLYHRREGGAPIAHFDLTKFLDTTKKSPEADIEGATELGGKVYWITSHAPNKDGKERPNRYRLFATEIKGDGKTAEVAPVGQPYKNLLSDMLTMPELEKYGLAEASKRPPKARDALNIEGLSATPDGKLLIGLRNPIPAGKALIVPLENPADVIEGKPAKFSPPIELELGDLGIRSIEYSPARKAYVVVAGAFDGEDRSRLFLWSGNPSDAPKPVEGVNFEGWNPEALVFYADDADRIQILSDDGGLKTNGVRCKDMPEESRRFRSGWIRVPVSGQATAALPRAMVGDVCCGE
jgi:hypothetical protein